jgi:nucleoid-associated protein YgaU
MRSSVPPSAGIVQDPPRRALYPASAFTNEGGSMALSDKYADVLGLAQQVGVKNGDWKEENGKIRMWGTTEYQLDANRIWDKIKEHPGWEKEVQADIKAERSDLFGVYEVKSGDTLSKIAKQTLGDSNRYTEIFQANNDQIKDPNLIKPGQRLKIPKP